MLNKKQKELIYRTVDKMIDNSSSSIAINHLEKKHNTKIHFIPKRYRIFGGILQSLNIQFGNFIEELISQFIIEDGRYEIIDKYSGNKNNYFLLSDYNDTLIDNYITKCQTDDNIDLDKEFNNLLLEIIKHRNDKSKNFRHDIDLLFMNKKTKVKYYLEIKYNDDHDSDKFVSINRKFIKTYAYLVNKFDITNKNELVPILFYFTNKKMKGNIYVPEKTNIYRGSKFFDKFLNIKYEDLDIFLNEFSESNKNINRFNDLYNIIIGN